MKKLFVIGDSLQQVIEIYNFTPDFIILLNEETGSLAGTVKINNWR